MPYSPPLSHTSSHANNKPQHKPRIYLSTARPFKANGSAIQAEPVTRLKHVGIRFGPVDLLVQTAPLGLVDGVDPVLDLHDDAAVLLDDTRAISDIVQALGGFEGDGACAGVSWGWIWGVEIQPGEGERVSPFWPPQE